MTKRAVVYARVSRDDTKQEGRNLESQIEMGKEYAAKRNYRIVATLKEDDRGASGAEINLPKLNEVREMARTKQLDVLIVREIDRLSRSLAKQLIIEEELKRCGVEIQYVLGEYPDTPEGTLMRHIRATVAEYEREKISERVIRGKYNKVKSGSVLVNGHTPYGYLLDCDDNRYELKIHEPEAAIVRNVFEWYVSGISCKKIAQRLNEERVPTYSDNRPDAPMRYKRNNQQGKWREEVVRRIVLSETYVGKWYFGKNASTGSASLRPKEEWVCVPVPAIVTQEIWDAAARICKSKGAVRTRETGYNYLLKHMVFCVHCRYRMSGRTAYTHGYVYPYYRCIAQRREWVDQCANASEYYKAEEVEQAVWEWIKLLLIDPEQLHQGLRMYQTQKEEKVAPLRERLRLIIEMLAPERNKLTRLLDLYLSGEFTKDMLIDRKTRLEERIQSLEKEQLELEMQLHEQTLSDEQIDTVQRFGSEIAHELDLSTESREVMHHIFSILNVEVVLGCENGQKFADVKCGIGERQGLPLSISSTNSLWCPTSAR